MSLNDKIRSDTKKAASAKSVHCQIWRLSGFDKTGLIPCEFVVVDYIMEKKAWLK